LQKRQDPEEQGIENMRHCFMTLATAIFAVCTLGGCATAPSVIAPPLPSDTTLKLVIEFNVDALRQGDDFIIPFDGDPYLCIFQVSKPDARYFAPLQLNRTVYEFSLDGLILENGGEVVVELWDDDNLSEDDIEAVKRAAGASTKLLVGLATSGGYSMYVDPNAAGDLAGVICHFNVAGWDLIGQGRYKVPPNGFTREVYANAVTLLCPEGDRSKGSFRVFTTRNR
jgi:hypothetical protein